MTSPQQPRKPPGLASIHKAREERIRGKFSRPSGAMFGYAGLAVVASILAYRFFEGRQIEEAKSSLLAKQRAASQELGARWFPLRDRIEAATLDAAKSWEGDRVEPEAMRWDFRAQPGIYLRTRLAEATDVTSLRRAASESVKDGFTGCLLRSAAAQAAADAGPVAAAFPDQPWNLRQAYAATRVLTPEWVSEVRDASDDLRLRVFDQQYAKAVSTEIPLAFDIVARARFFLLVLDEDVDAARAVAGDAGRITEEALQLVPHPSRVHLVNLKTGKEIARLRRIGEASFIFAGEQHAVDEETRNAMQRQVNNCSLAKQVDEALSAPRTDATDRASRDAGRE